MKVEMMGGPGFRQMSVGWVVVGVMESAVGKVDVGVDGMEMVPLRGVLSSWWEADMVMVRV